MYYYGARWYDPALGHFIRGPSGRDTLVPDAGNALDYHRYGYARFNALKYTDPSGHAGCTVTAAPVMLQDPGFCSGGISGIILVALVQAANTGAPAVAQWGDKAYAMADGVYQIAQQAEQASHGAGQNAGNSSTGDPNGLDPNKLSRWTQTVEQSLEQAKTLGSNRIETTTPMDKIASQFQSKSSLLGINVSGNMQSLTNPNVQKGLQSINSVLSNPNKIWEGTWKTQDVYEYIDTQRGIGVVLHKATGQLITILQRDPAKLNELESFVQNGTARWIK